MTLEGAKRKKRKFLKAFEANGGFAYAAAKSAGVCKSVAYEWRQKDTDFREAWEEIAERSGEAVENSFYKNHCTGEKPNPVAQIFYLKCKRNYRESDNPQDVADSIINYKSNLKEGDPPLRDMRWGPKKDGKQ